jgi:DNA-binding response OmpR family regulator
MALLERDSAQAAHVQSWIEEADCHCTLYRAVEEFQRGFYHMSHDVVILDWMARAPVSGQDVLYWIRESLGNTVPVVVINSCRTERDAVRALYAGADDYLVKPLRRNELLARLHALVRRTHREPDVLSCAPYVLDASNHQLRCDSDVVRLTRMEFELTAYLFRHRGRIVSRELLMISVWGKTDALNPRTVDTHISRLCAKLPLLASGHWNLASTHQRGYRLEEQAGTDSAGL